MRSKRLKPIPDNGLKASEHINELIQAYEEYCANINIYYNKYADVIRDYKIANGINNDLEADIGNLRGQIDRLRAGLWNKLKDIP